MDPVDENVSTATNRVSALEQRILELAKQFEPLPDIRAAATEPAGVDLDALLAHIDRLTREVRARESGTEWDVGDQLAARLMLQAIAGTVVELRRALAVVGPMLQAAHGDVRETERHVDAVERQYQDDGDAAADLAARLDRVKRKYERDALPVTATPRD